MRVLLFPIAGQNFAVDARHVHRVIPGADGEPDDGAPEIDLTALLPGSTPAGEGQVLLRDAGSRACLRTGIPRGFVDVDPARVAPVPAYLFPEGRRLVRAAFEDDTGLCLLLDAGVLLSAEAGACT